MGATSYKETSFGIIPRSKLLQLEVEGTKRGLDMILRSSQLEITPKLILDLHDISFGWIFPDWAGKFRVIRVEFSGKEAPQHYLVPEFMTNLCSDLKERLKNLNNDSESYIDEVVELLAWFQHKFVWIHPFQDYNGRLARMLTILILLKLNLPAIEIKAGSNLDRKRYLKAMQLADENDYSKLEVLIRNALNESLIKINSE